jgi:diacylglycerol kinase (ATP)
MKSRPFTTRLGFAFAGLRAAWRHEKSFRTQSWLALAVLLLLLLVRPALLWWALIGVMVAAVLAAELINTALEHLADHLHPEHHPKIKLVKDCAAAAVLLLSLGAVWLVIIMLLEQFDW